MRVRLGPMASSPSRTSLVRRTQIEVRRWESPSRRDAQTNTRDACATYSVARVPGSHLPQSARVAKVSDLVAAVLCPPTPTINYGVGRGCGLGRGLGVALAVAVGVAVAVAVGVAVAVAVAVGVGVGVAPHGVALDAGVGETVGVGAGVPTAAAISTRPQPHSLLAGPAGPHRTRC